ncbi:DEKNAAC104674 [Brettanomyces naardenensis]|uniref:DEKNAAC104674 n=1 Tax=Brettanomyces naardenensis TaxID=13370 RepID=A0A448YR29_BRENA|nr:DEKNAAC104674 [Brettanomyces naardenensis]
MSWRYLAKVREASKVNLSDIEIVTAKVDQLDSLKEQVERPRMRMTKSDKHGRSSKAGKSDRSNRANGSAQGAQKAAPIVDRGAITADNSLTDFYQEMKAIIDKYSHRIDGEYVVLVQVGSFYELYFEQAERHANMLGLTLTKKKLKNQDVSFAGFPDYKLDKYLKIIFTEGLKAVICDQKRNGFDNVIKRPIDRLVTPGTVVDDGLRDYHRNNFLLAITFPDDPFKTEIPDGKIGLAWCDVTLGSFHVLETNFNDLMAAITRINPSEIVVNNSFKIDYLASGRWLPQFADLRRYYITKFSIPSTKKHIEEFTGRFSENKRLIISTFDDLKMKELSASKLLLYYLDECIPNYVTSFQLPARSFPNEVMHIDPRAAQDLELTETIRGGLRVGALANIIDRTQTNPGARLLNSWLLMPSTDISEIKKRQKVVSIMLRYEDFTEDLVVLLRKTSDTSRIIRRVDNNRAELSEYLELSSTVFLLEEIYKIASETPQILKVISPLFEKFNSTPQIHKLALLIKRTVDPNAPSKAESIGFNGFRLDTDITRHSWRIQRLASKRLSELRNTYDTYLEEYDALHALMKTKLEVFGYTGGLRLIRHLRTGEFLVELKSSSKSLSTVVDEISMKHKEKTKTSVKLVVPEWEELGRKLIHLESDILLEESLIMRDLERKIFSLANSLKDISPIIEFLDTTQSFANLAREKNLVCPEVDSSTDFEIAEGRHLVVEEGLKDRSLGVENFTSNSCSLKSGRAWIITGPNMGGKSTFLRQNALIAILAQIGSFVPAVSARIGIIDKIFTRVGSSDSIFKNQSTFMVEMNETAIILRESTEKSLVIVDELGRGTSTGEGVAIAFASLLTMVKTNSSKVLFATHFGPELFDKIQSCPELDDCIEFYRSELKKIDSNVLPIDEKIVFNHKLKRGLSVHSHALEIAELAGFPASTLRIAVHSLGRSGEREITVE